MNPSPNAGAAHPMIEWAVENLARGCDENTMFKTMIDSGWRWRDAHQFMQAALRRAVAPARAAALPRPRSELFGSGGAPDGQPSRVSMHLADPEVALVSGMISAQECLDLIELGRARLARSLTVADGSPRGEMSHPDRSSDGAGLHNVDHPAIDSVLARASWMFDWPRENFEGLQILRYLPGQEYKPHHDWFDPSTPGGSSQLSFGGQRVATAVAYLNDCPEGGGTAIPALGIRAAPIRGNAIFFSYASDRAMNGDARLLHSGEPVLAGEKWVCTFWMRQERFGKR